MHSQNDVAVTVWSHEPKTLPEETQEGEVRGQLPAQSQEGVGAQGQEGAGGSAVGAGQHIPYLDGV